MVSNLKYIRIFKNVNSTRGCSKKSPYLVLPSNLSFVLPSDSEASLTSIGTASLLTSFGTASRDVIPRRLSAEGPLTSFGMTLQLMRHCHKRLSLRFTPLKQPLIQILAIRITPHSRQRTHIKHLPKIPVTSLLY